MLLTSRIAFVIFFSSTILFCGFPNYFFPPKYSIFPSNLCVIFSALFSIARFLQLFHRFPFFRGISFIFKLLQQSKRKFDDPGLHLVVIRQLFLFALNRTFALIGFSFVFLLVFAFIFHFILLWPYFRYKKNFIFFIFIQKYMVFF